MKKKKKKKDGTLIGEGRFLKEQLTGVEGTEGRSPLFSVAMGVVGFGIGYVVGRRTRSQPESTLGN